MYHYLLRQTEDGPGGLRTDLVSILSDQKNAMALATEWVEQGRESYDKTEPGYRVESAVTGAIFRVWRQNDHGQRRATVQPLAVDDTPKGIA